MKTFGFYSPSTKEFAMVVAYTINDAIAKFNEFNKMYGIVADDYIIAGNVSHSKVGDVNTFTCF